MATSFLLQTYRPFATLLLVFTLLINCRFCQSNELTLEDFACAKVGAKLNDGFTLIKDDQLRIDPSKLTPKGRDNNTKVHHGLLLNSKADLIISIFITKNKSCNEEVFKRHVFLPTNICSFGNESEVSPEHKATNNVCKGQGTNCAYFNVTCRFPMASVETLTDSRYFTISAWKNVSYRRPLGCEWTAFIDDVRIMLHKSEADSATLEKCSTKRSSWRLIVLLLCLFVILLAILAAAAVLFYAHKRKRTSRRAVKKPGTESASTNSSANHSTTAAAQFGVEVPSSLRSNESDEEEGPQVAIQEKGSTLKSAVSMPKSSPSPADNVISGIAQSKKPLQPTVPSANNSISEENVKTKIPLQSTVPSADNVISEKSAQSKKQ